MSSNSLTENPHVVPASRSPWRSLLTKAAFILVVLVTLVVGFFLVEKKRGQAAWKQYQDEARARGVKLNLMEYVPAPVPDERNFATVPIFRDAFLKDRPPNPFALPGGQGTKLPQSASLQQGQSYDLAAWQAFFVQTKLLPAAGDNAAADVLKALEHYAAPWEQLRTAAARPESRFPVRYEDGIAAALPHVEILQRASRLNALRMAAHLALGDSPAAYEDFRLGMRLYTALEKEATLIAGLVRLSMLATLENTVWSGLAQRQWGAPELEKIIADLGERKLLDDYQLGFGSERGFQNLLYDQLIRNGTKELGGILSMMASESGPFSKQRAAGALLSFYPSGWLLLGQTRTNRYFDEALARVTQNPPRVDAESALTTFPLNPKELGMLDRGRYLLFLMMVPAVDGIVRQYAYAQTLLDETRLGCALERYRLVHGSFPDSLDALAPAMLPALPRDVITGESFHFQVEKGGGYKLYAVGWNRVDDHGQNDPKTSAKDQPDWVWTIPARP